MASESQNIKIIIILPILQISVKKYHFKKAKVKMISLELRMNTLFSTTDEKRRLSIVGKMLRLYWSNEYFKSIKIAITLKIILTKHECTYILLSKIINVDHFKASLISLCFKLFSQLLLLSSYIYHVVCFCLG